MNFKKTFAILVMSMTLTLGLGALAACSDSFGEWEVVKEPTCTEDGEQIRFSESDDTVFETEVIPALGHDWIDEGDENGWIVTVEPTYETEGEMQRKCRRCGLVETKIVDMIDEPIHLSIMDGTTLLYKIYVNDDGSYDLTNETASKTGYTFVKFIDGNGDDYQLTGSITENTSVYTVWDITPTTTLAQLAEYAAASVDKIEIAADIVLTESVYVVGKTEIYVKESHTLTRGVNFSGDMFIVGETKDGENTQIVYGRQAALTLKTQDGATLTIDGNKENVQVEVGGTAILILYGAEVNINDGVAVQNCKKVTNIKLLDSPYSISYPDRIGGAAVIVVSGTLNMHGGAISNNEVNLDETSETAEGDESARDSSCGGAIYSNSNVNIYGGVLEDNKAARGGAIYNYRTLQIEGGELRGNTAGAYGGAVYLPGSQYAQLFIGAEEAQDNVVTFAANSADKSGGAIFGQMKNSITVYGATSFTANTAKGNGGAINTSGALTVLDATFRENKAASKGGAIYVYYANSELTTRQVEIKSGSFEQNEASKGGAITFSASSAEFEQGSIGIIGTVDFLGNKAFATETDDPDLSDMEDDSTGSYNGNGGALYIARNSDVTITGATFRGNNAAIKGGAIYVTGGSSLKISAAELDSNSSDEKAGAIYMTSAAQVDISGNSLFQSNTAASSGGAILCYTDAVLTVKDTTFESNSSSDAKYGGGAIYFASHAEGSFDRVSFNGNRATAHNGGAVSVYGGSHVVIKNNSAFTENTAANYGGAMYVTSDASRVEISDTTFTSNEAVGNGGAIYGYGTSTDGEEDESGTIVITLIVKDSTFTENAAGKYGGAIYCLTDAVLNVESSSFTSNEALRGGAIYVTGATVTVSGGKFEQNETAAGSGNNGGAIGVYGNSELTVEDGTQFIRNSSGYRGGAIYVTDGKSVVTVIGATFTENETAENGGALYIYTGAELTLEDCDFIENIAANRAGAIYLSGATATITNGTFDGNAANTETSGAIGVYSSSTLTVDGTEFKNNEAKTNGGAVYSSGGEVTITNATFDGNTAGGTAGAIGAYSSSNLTVTETEFKNNEATSTGGALHIKGSSVAITDATFADNTASGNGGAVYFDTGSSGSVNGSTFTGNSAAGGGAIYFLESSVTLDNATFVENTAKTGNGGALYVYTDSVVTMGGLSTFTDNSAPASGKFGGAIYASGAAVLRIKEVAAAGNSASKGGFLYLTTTNTKVYIYGGSVTENVANEGGNFYGNVAGALLYTEKGQLETDDYTVAGKGTQYDTIDEEWGSWETQA